MTADTTRIPRAARIAATLAALGALAACAGPAPQEPMYDYGLGQLGPQTPWLHQAAIAEPLMDYGFGQAELPVTAVATAAGATAGPLAALSR